METTEQTMIDILFSINHLKQTQQEIITLIAGSEGEVPPPSSTK